MTTLKNNSFLKETNNADKNYQLNMEILSSLKSLPGKVVNLQSEKYIFKNDEINMNKKVMFPEEKFTTSSSISKELFCDPFSNEIDKIHKKSYTTNSVFKPIPNLPIKKTTMNYYNLSSMMSFSDFLVPNPNQNYTAFNPLKITNSSFSKNSFYPVNNPDNNLINPINTINPINIINPVTPFFQNFTQIPLFTEQIIKKNNFIQTKNNILLNKKRNADTEININNNNNTKEKKEKELDIIKNNNIIKNNIQKPKSTFFCIKQKPKQILEIPKKKNNLFITIQKSNYIYRKRKPRKKKLLNGIKNKMKCGHDGCEAIFKTKKQLLYHHFKMSVECHNDTVNLLKMIYLTKKLLLKKADEKEKEKILKKYSKLYKETMNNISLDEYIETLVGFNFEDDIQNYNLEN